MRVVLLMFVLTLNMLNAQEQKATKLEYLSKNFLDFNVEGKDNLYVYNNSLNSLLIEGDKKEVNDHYKKEEKKDD